MSRNKKHQPPTLPLAGAGLEAPAGTVERTVQVDEAASVSPDASKQAFLDQVVIACYAKGYPLANVWQHAEKLWASRCQFMAQKSRENRATKGNGE